MKVHPNELVGSGMVSSIIQWLRRFLFVMDITFPLQADSFVTMVTFGPIVFPMADDCYALVIVRIFESMTIVVS